MPEIFNHQLRTLLKIGFVGKTLIHGKIATIVCVRKKCSELSLDVTLGSESVGLYLISRISLPYSYTLIWTEYQSHLAGAIRTVYGEKLI